MGQARRKYTQEYKDEAVELVISSGRPMAEIARDLGINEGTLGSWVSRAKPQSTGRFGVGRFRSDSCTRGFLG